MELLAAQNSIIKDKLWSSENSFTQLSYNNINQKSLKAKYGFLWNRI